MRLLSVLQQIKSGETIFSEPSADKAAVITFQKKVAALQKARDEGLVFGYGDKNENWSGERWITWVTVGGLTPDGEAYLQK